MKQERAIDLEQQLIELFDKEDVLAFFDFQMALDQEAAVQGLCKISEPKKKDSMSNYLSLLFIIDTTADAIEGVVRSLMKGISWSDLQKQAKEIELVIPMPHVSHGTSHYIEEIELYLGPQRQITKSFLTDDLYPAIVKTLGCNGNGLILWDERPRRRKDTNRDIHRETDRSLIERVIAYFAGR